MAGYFRKLVGRVYNGSYVAGEDLMNGMFVTVDNGVVVPNTEDADIELRCVEKTTLWGLPALVLDVTNACGREVYMVENDFLVEEYGEYDEAMHTVKAGELVKMKLPLAGEQIIVSVDSEVYDAAEVGATNCRIAGANISVQRAG